MEQTYSIFLGVAMCLLGGSAHAQRVVPVGTGFIGSGVRDAVIYENKLWMGGQFIRFNDVDVRGLCTWDGATVGVVESGLTSASGRVFDLELLGDRLVACFSNSNHGMVAAWDGQQWTDLGVVPFSPVETIHAHGDVLYAGNNDGQVFKWESGAWAFLGNVAPHKINALTVHEGVLYAGSADGPNVTDGHLHAYDGGSWQMVGGGLNGAVTKLHSTSNGLYVAGSFTASNNGQPLNKLALWDGQVFAELPFTPIASVDGIGKDPDGLLFLSIAHRVYTGPDLSTVIPVDGRGGIHELNGTRYMVGASPGMGDGYFPCNGMAKLLSGTNSAKLDINNVSAVVTPKQNSFDPWWFNDGTRFRAPKSGIANAVYSSSPWLLATHGGERYASLPAFGGGTSPDGRNDHAGPHALVMDDAFLERYHRVWKLDRAQVQAHIAGWNAPGYTMPEAIASWPGNGDESNGEPAQLAPFADLNANGVYEPQQGEYPVIKGDQAVYAITHTNDRFDLYGGTLQSLPFDLHIMHYSFHGDGDHALDHTVFINYKYVNRSDLLFTDIRYGQYADIDIGNPDDDFAGCDSIRNMFFAYNWDDNDETTISGLGYGTQPPALGVRFLSQPLRSHRNIPSAGPEVVSLDDAMYGLWYGAPFTQLGYPTHFQYPGGSFIEQQITLANSDRRSVGATGPFTLGPGDTLCMDLAFIYARAAGGGAYASVEALKLRADSVQAAYDVFNTGCTSYPSMVGITERQDAPSLLLYPNPARTHLTVQVDAHIQELSVLDMQGRILLQRRPSGKQVVIDIQHLSSGTYLLRALTPAGIAARTVVVEH